MKRFGTIMLTCVVYLGLAIWGWGGFGPFFSNTALGALAAVTVIASLVATVAPGSLSAGVQEDRGNRWVLSAFTIIGLVLGFLPAWSDRHNIATLDGNALRWVGVALSVVGSVLRLWPVFILGDRFSGLVAIQQGHTLVTSGPYSVIRHPSYLGLLVGTLGWSLGFRSLFGVLLTALLLIPLVARMNAEERLLRAHFGEPYDAYRARTSRLIPYLY